MSQSLFSKSNSAQPLLDLNLRDINQLFPGFSMNDFAVLHGSLSVLSLSSMLCVRAQLPTPLGGLGSNVIFIDGGNTFRLYQIARLARLHQLDPKKTLKRIYISRAFTAYQLTSLILEKLDEVVKRYDAKLVVISDIAGLFLDKEIPDEEARRVFSHIATYLSNFTKENQLILLSTYLPHQETRRNNFLHAITCGSANVVLSLRKTRENREFVLEKHPYYVLDSARLPSESIVLTDFMEFRP